MSFPQHAERIDVFLRDMKLSLEDLDQVSGIQACFSADVPVGEVGAFFLLLFIKIVQIASIVQVVEYWSHGDNILKKCAFCLSLIIFR